MWPETDRIWPEGSFDELDDDHLVNILVQVEKMRWELRQEVLRRGCEALLSERLKELFGEGQWATAEAEP